MDNVKFATVMLLAGIGIPMLAALNARLGTRIGSPAAAATVLFSIALLASASVAALTGSLSAVSLVPTQPKHLLLAGLLIAFYVLSVTWIAPRFGVGNAVFCVLLGQMISAAIIDHFGLFGAPVRSLESWRAIGLVLMAAGVATVQFGPR